MGAQSYGPIEVIKSYHVTLLFLSRWNGVALLAITETAV